MGRFALITVLALLVLNCSAEKKLWRSWYYAADVRATNNINDASGSVWGITANLETQRNGDKVVFKFDNVETAFTNGLVGLPPKRYYRPITKEVEAILKPVVLYLGNPSNYTIGHEADDPVWSVNLKRSAISTLLLAQSNKNSDLLEQQTIFGECQVSTTTKTEKDNDVLYKTIDHSTCENSPNYEFSTRQWDPSSSTFSPFSTETNYTYYFNGTADMKHLNEIRTFSVLTYQSMPGVRSSQKVESSKYFHFLEQSETLKFYDLSKITSEKHNITYDYSKGYAGGRDEIDPKATSEELVDQFNTNYEEFKKYFNDVPLLNRNAESNDTLTPMFDSLYDMKKETLEKLGNDIFATKDNLYQHMFLSILPYLGTAESIKFIKSLIENEDENLNDLLAIKILSTFPVYAEDYNEELIKEMEPLMNLKVSNNQVKYAGILSFASLLHDAFTSTQISEEKYVNYAGQYYKKFVESDDYEVKMTYLLGLINLRHKAFINDIFEICVNTNYSHHLRALAIYGFQPLLIAEGQEVYKHFWPIIQNKEEHYEVKVAAVDLLLHSDISYEQFQSVIAFYEQVDSNEDKHLANYIYTTLQSLENSTGYFEYLGDYATEAIETLKPIKNDHVWTTGNYRMAFTDTDSNFGGAMQARLIANPTSNIINTGIFSVNTFAISLNLGTYTAYIKTEGIPDIAFLFLFFSTRESENPIKHLKELIKKHGYKIKELKDVHIEVVLFADERVVFGMHINKDNIENYAENPLFLDLLKLIIEYNSLTYPLQDYTFLISDTGTSIKISNDIVEIEKYELENLDKFFTSFGDSSEEVDAIEYNLKYRSIWSYSVITECYNPLVGTSAATYKWVNDESLINIPYSFNFTDLVFKWKHTKDSINWIRDHTIGHYVEEKYLTKFCVEYCEPVFEYPVGDVAANILKSDTIGSITGIDLNVTSIAIKSYYQATLESQEPQRLPSYIEVLRNHKSNSLSDSFGNPILLLWHATLYNTFLANDLYTISVRTEPHYQEPTETVFDLDFDVNDIKNDDDPISGEEFDFTVAFTHRKSNDAEVLSYMNLTYVSKTRSETPAGESQPHIEHSYDVHFYIDNKVKDTKYKICVDREILYPNRRVDKFSLESVDPAKATTKILFDDVQSIDDKCPSTNEVIVTEIYTATEKQKEQMKSLNEYFKCKKESEGFKYVPPTANCLATHNFISRYDAGILYIDLSKVEDINEKIYENATSEFGLAILEYKRLNSTHISVSLSKNFIDTFVHEVPEDFIEKSTVDTEDASDLMSLNPTVVAYDDHDLLYGASSACYISPNQIQSFYGVVVDNYNQDFGPDAVAFVECINNTQSGLTIQRIGDTKVGFNFWSENNHLVASAHDGKVKIVYNGEPRSETDIKDDDFKIYFLDQDVVYVTNSIVDIHYTTEYISIKAPTVYNNYICGLCTGDRH